MPADAASTSDFPFLVLAFAKYVLEKEDSA